MQRMINDMIFNTSMILQRKDREQTKRLREIWIETGILLDEWNEETDKILRET